MERQSEPMRPPKQALLRYRVIFEVLVAVERLARDLLISSLWTRLPRPQLIQRVSIKSSQMPWELRSRSTAAQRKAPLDRCFPCPGSVFARR